MRILKISFLVFILSSSVSAQTEWEYLGLAGESIWDIEIDGTGSIYVGVEQGPIYKSTDNGVTWVLKNNGFTSSFGEDIAIYNNQIYVTTLTGLFKSTNGGDSWFRIAQSIPFLDFDMVSIIPNGYIFTSVFNMGTGGLFRSTDQGVTWQATSYIGFGPLDLGINSNGIMFLGNHTASWYGIQRSFDLGMNWQWVYPYIAATALEYLNDGSVLAGELFDPLNCVLYKSTDDGNSWFNTNTFSGPNEFTDFVLDTNDDIYVSIMGTQQGVYLSITSGSSWDFKGLSNVDVICLAIDSSGYVYAGTGSNGIFRMPGRTTPVELISFIADVFKNEVKLNWSTATETNNSGFEILRFAQNDNNGWNKIGFVPGHGTTTKTQHYSFTDNNVKPCKYQYKLKQIDYDGSFEYSQIVEVEVPFVNEFSLSQNYPNPFNPVTKIKYNIPSVTLRQAQSDIKVTLKVYDILGREVATLVNEEKPAGEYEVEFNGIGLPSGIYFYQLKAGEYSETRKMILIK